MYTAENWPIAAKMSFCTVTETGQDIREAGPKVWQKHLRQVKNKGFDCIDPIDEWVPFTELNDQEYKDFKQVLADEGLYISSLSMGRRSVIDEVHGEEYLAMGHRYIEKAVDLGSKIVNVGFMQALTEPQKKALWFWYEQGHVDDPKNRDLALERITELADHAKEVGVEISLEMYEDTFIGTPEGAVSFIKDLNHDAVGINPDVGNLIRLHRPMPKGEEMYSQVLPYANFWHIKNYIRDEDVKTGAYFSTPSTLEDGTINYRLVIREALRLGFQGPFLAEQYGGDWLGVSWKNAQYIREILRDAEETNL